MRRGNMLDFVQLLGEDPSLRSDLVELARKHGFEFEPVELTDDQLDGVAGGTSLEVRLRSLGDDSQLAQLHLQNWLQRAQQTLQTMHNVSTSMHDAAMGITRKMG